MSEYLLFIDRDELFHRILRKCKIIESTEPYKDCWLYEGWDDGKGYKKISLYGKGYYVHRIMYIITLMTPILKPRHDLIHLCGNRACCNPYHMKTVKRGKEK